ncbi:uncharacterized protein B0P05DRAFT_525436 [Gilbertella persicaria]|uniref:uncharacterized protein n=1 Tax=Gilbertella persicaria TaxID=101096 RepID=UPI00221F8691|nr:uncharacterized protein B0P05DRAFT_525436 [Gilbertella persicaria]KAI8092246.1 hypothetical protein B0P05DRAFT_525436 [Gilbertella persicaria]
MYQQRTEKSTWTRLRSQRYGKRIAPLRPLAEKKTPTVHQKKASKINAVVIQKAFINMLKQQEQLITPDDNDDSLSTPSLSISSFSEQDTTELDWLQELSQTCPNLSSVVDTSFDDRPLPPLPLTKQQKEASSHSSYSSTSLELQSRTSYFKRHAAIKMTRAASKGQIQLKRAATWLGLAGQKLLASPQVQSLGLYVSQKYHSASENVLLRLTQSYGHNLNHLTTGKRPQEKEKPPQLSNDIIYGTDSDHCAFIKNQLKLKASPEKKTKYSVNKRKFIAPKRIMYCRVMQIINLASTRDCDYELHVQLNNVTMATKRGVLRKIEKNASADRPYDEALVFEIQEPFSLNFVVAARHTNTIFRDGLAKMGIWPLTNDKTEKETKLPIAGYICLNFENKMDVLDQGVSRFRLTKPVDKSFNRWLNIELLIDIKVEEILPAVVHRFPWSYTTSQHSALSYESVEEDIVSNPKELITSQQHCQQGDYLTIYTRGRGHPTWKRYWVVKEEHQLALYDFSFKDTKEPLSIIPLAPLMAVAKPSLDDCESVGLSRKTGIMLQFNRSSAILTEFVRLESDEGLEGKAYIFGDSEQHTIHWRRTLSAYVSDQTRDTVTSKEGVDLKFLW